MTTLDLGTSFKTYNIMRKSHIAKVMESEFYQVLQNAFERRKIGDSTHALNDNAGIRIPHFTLIGNN